MGEVNNFWGKDIGKYFDIKDESRKSTLYPKILELVEASMPETVLDYGCGDGELLEMILNNNKINVYAYDKSDMAIIAAKKRLGNRVKFCSESSSIKKGWFDVVICSLVIMTIPSRVEIKDMIKSIKLAKKKEGVAIFAITHPCFRMLQFSTFITEYTNKNGFDYFSEGSPFEVTIFDRSSHKKVSFTDYHWTLGSNINMLIEEGLSIVKIMELKDNLSYGNRNFPPYLIIVAK